MVRRPLGGPLVELRHGPAAEQRSTWLLVSERIAPGVTRWGLRACPAQRGRP
jgi:hypothetical protein